MTALTTPVSLSAPLYGATWREALTRFFKKYATFSGRASRSEFWFAYLAVMAVNVLLYIVMMVAIVMGTSIDQNGMATAGVGGFFIAPLLFLWAAGTLVPMLALMWRRLHDTNRSGAFAFLALIPAVGGIILLVLLALPSDRAGSSFDV